MDPVMRNPSFAGSSGAAPPSIGSGPQLLAIEGELSGPGAQQALERHDAVLLGLENRLADALREGVPPDEFPKLAQLREANTIARKLLRLAVADARS